MGIMRRIRKGDEQESCEIGVILKANSGVKMKVDGYMQK